MLSFLSEAVFFIKDHSIRLKVEFKTRHDTESFGLAIIWIVAGPPEQDMTFIGKKGGKINVWLRN